MDGRHAPRMNRLSSGDCPACGELMHMARLECDACGTAVEGHFVMSGFSRLNPEQLLFLESFVRNRGVIKDIEVDLGMSYPTVKSRLDDIVSTLGFDRDANQVRPSKIREERRAILERVNAGELSASDAIRRLSELGERRSS